MNIKNGEDVTQQCSLLDDIRDGLGNQAPLRSTVEDVVERLGNQASNTTNDSNVEYLNMFSKLYELVKDFFLLRTSERLQYELDLVNRKLESYKRKRRTSVHYSIKVKVAFKVKKYILTFSLKYINGKIGCCSNAATMGAGNQQKTQSYNP